MAPSEKANHAYTASQHNAATVPPRDLPPSYENTISPSSTGANVGGVPNLATSNGPNSTTIRIPSQNPLAAISRLASIDFPRYCMTQAKLSDDHTSVTTSKPELQGTQYALARFVHEQAALPPKPIMVVRGTHVGGGARHGETIVDFDLKINLMSLLDVDSPEQSRTISSSRMRVKVFSNASAESSSSTLPSPAPTKQLRGQSGLSTLDQWVKKFCEDKTDNRSFTLHRHPANLPSAILEGMIRTLLAATKYRGKVSVEFPVQYAAVTVLRQSGNWFTNMLRLYPTKRYEVVETVWTVGATAGGADKGSNGGTGNGSVSIVDVPQTTSVAAETPNGHDREGPSTEEGNGRAGLVAQEWWREWQFAVWNAVLGGKQGWVTVEDWIEAKMGVRVKERARDWGVDYDG